MRSIIPQMIVCPALCATAWSAPLSSDASIQLVNADTSLHFRADGTFHLSIFNDLHYGEDEANPPEKGWGPISDIRSTRVLNTLLDVERPDLAVLNGDLITGENTYAHNATLYLDQVMDPIVSRNIKFAVSYGNHDADRNLSPLDLHTREKARWPSLSLSQRYVVGDVDDVGVSNYFIPVYGSKGFNGKDSPVMILWFFDSRGGKKRDGSGRQGFVSESVARWFTGQRDSINKQVGRVLPSLAFVHIPVEAIPVFQAQNGGIDPNRNPGLNDDSPAASQDSAADLPFLRALAGTKGLMGVFSGHDHGNDWCRRWTSDQDINGVRGNGAAFCFGGHTGYGGYGKWMRGSRTVVLRQDSLGKEFETWMSLENRQQSGRVKINDRFGSDNYPPVQRKFST